MPRPAKEDGHNRAGRYRAQKRRLGMRLLRIWVPDPRAPGFREEARRQAALLRGAPEEQEALDFIEGVMAADDIPLDETRRLIIVAAQEITASPAPPSSSSPTRSRRRGACSSAC